jgi:predicted DNA-binding protein YlxM (UPF0122 family)
MAKKRKLNGEIAKSNAGRPSVFTPEVITKLEQAFAIDCSVEEACSYADISRNAFYEWLKANEAFNDRITDLRQRPVLKARQTVVQKLGESYQNGMDYLKRKKKLEFGDAIDFTGNLTISQALDKAEKDL